MGTVASAVLQSSANMYNAKQTYMTEGYNITNSNYQYGEQQQQNMVNGLFTAAASYGAGEYARKVPGSTGTLATGSPSATTNNYTSFGATPKLGYMNRPYAPNLGSTPGTSLASGLGT